LLNSQRLNDPGNTTASEEAAKTRYSHGTELRTENWIMDEMPKAVDISTVVILIPTARQIGATISENNFHSLRALLLSNVG